MKYFALITVGMAFLLASFNVLPENKENEPVKGIKFESISFEQALEQAKATNKLIFMDAYAVWCGPCKWMDANSFKDQAVGDFFNENFINLKVDMEKGEGPNLARRYKVTAYPTLFFINAEGEIVERVLGAKPAKDLLKIGRKVAE